MSDVAIRVENLGKMYRIGGAQERYRTLRDSLTDAMSAPFKRARSLLRGQAYGAAGLEETIWALKDVSFEVKHGEVVGIIGRNGAGKSTLLKILSRITDPTEGYVDVYGRVGSLLEVGTGFHPELTGRENIYLNGAILGMSREEIDRKFDEIIAFAEVEKFIDTPVKHYSSGMGLRLGFAVSAYLEPEILIVDEVLAVGDVRFQQKCLNKMSGVAHQGRTVLFVSHNMTAISQLCNRAILLEQGKSVVDGEVSATIRDYLDRGKNDTSSIHFTDEPEKPMQIVSLSIKNRDGDFVDDIPFEEDFVFEIGYRVSNWKHGTYLAAAILNESGVIVLWSNDVKTEDDLLQIRNQGYYTAAVHVPQGILPHGRYRCSAAIVGAGTRQTFDFREEAIAFDINDTTSMLGLLGIKLPSVTAISLEWVTTYDSSLS